MLHHKTRRRWFLVQQGSTTFKFVVIEIQVPGAKLDIYTFSFPSNQILYAWGNPLMDSYYIWFFKLLITQENVFNICQDELKVNLPIDLSSWIMGNINNSLSIYEKDILFSNIPSNCFDIKAEKTTKLKQWHKQKNICNTFLPYFEIEITKEQLIKISCKNNKNFVLPW